jgi:VanZ family protein
LNSALALRHVQRWRSKHNTYNPRSGTSATDWEMTILQQAIRPRDAWLQIAQLSSQVLLVAKFSHCSLTLSQALKLSAEDSPTLIQKLNRIEHIILYFPKKIQKVLCVQSSYRLIGRGASTGIFRRVLLTTFVGTDEQSSSLTPDRCALAISRRKFFYHLFSLSDCGSTACNLN